MENNKASYFDCKDHYAIDLETAKIYLAVFLCFPSVAVKISLNIQLKLTLIKKCANLE